MSDVAISGVLGIVGTVVGVILSEAVGGWRRRTEGRAARREAEDGRVPAAARHALTAVSTGQSLAQAVLLTKMGRPPDTSQHLQVTEQFNEARASLHFLRAEALVKGPVFLPAPLDRLVEQTAQLQNLTSEADLGRRPVTTEWRDEVQATVNAIRAQVDDLLDQASQRE